MKASLQQSSCKREGSGLVVIYYFIFYFFFTLLIEKGLSLCQVRSDYPGTDLSYPLTNFYTRKDETAQMVNGFSLLQYLLTISVFLHSVLS